MTTWGALKNQLLDPPNRSRLGVMGLVVVLLGVAVGQTFTSVPMLFASPSYYGQFKNTGGLKKGDKVRITGMNVGSVDDIKIAGDRIVMKFSIGANTIGTESRLAARTDTILGKKVLQSNRVAPKRCGPAVCCRWPRAPRRIRFTTRSPMPPRPPPAGT